MYNELLSEANSNKNLETNITQLNDKIHDSKDSVDKKQRLLMLTQRRFENFEHVDNS